MSRANLACYTSRNGHPVHFYTALCAHGLRKASTDPSPLASAGLSGSCSLPLKAWHLCRCDQERLLSHGAHCTTYCRPGVRLERSVHVAGREGQPTLAPAAVPEAGACTYRGALMAQEQLTAQNPVSSRYLLQVGPACQCWARRELQPITLPRSNAEVRGDHILEYRCYKVVLP